MTDTLLQTPFEDYSGAGESYQFTIRFRCVVTSEAVFAGDHTPVERVGEPTYRSRLGWAVLRWFVGIRSCSRRDGCIHIFEWFTCSKSRGRSASQAACGVTGPSVEEPIRSDLGSAETPVRC